MLPSALMTQRQYLHAVLACGLFAGACTDKHDSAGNDNGGSDYDGSGSGGGSGSGSGGSGGGAGTDNNAGGNDDGADRTPTYSAEHPRIYLPGNKERLQAALAANTPQASRFKSVVDRWLSGADIYGFDVERRAARRAHRRSEVLHEGGRRHRQRGRCRSRTIAAGGRPDVASDSYLGVGDTIGNVMLTYDWCFDHTSAAQRTRWLTYANQAEERVAPDASDLGWRLVSVERLVDQQPVEQLLLLVLARDDADRPRREGRRPAGRRLDHDVPRLEGDRPARSHVR